MIPTQKFPLGHHLQEELQARLLLSLDLAKGAEILPERVEEILRGGYVHPDEIEKIAAWMRLSVSMLTKINLQWSGEYAHAAEGCGKDE